MGGEWGRGGGGGGGGGGGAEQTKNHKCMVIFPFLYTFADEALPGSVAPANYIKNITIVPEFVASCKHN